MSKRCLYIFKRGSKKGRPCGETSIVNSSFCSKHDAKESNDALDTMPAVSKRRKSLVDIQTKILALNTSDQNKSVILKHYKNTLTTDPNSTEFYKNKMFVDQSLAYPWDNYFDIKRAVGTQPIPQFLENLKSKLDEEIYGMDDVKNEFINMVCKFITNPTSNRNNIALYGAAGVGKNRFVKVLSDVLGLPMREISLGGIKDSSFFLGHGYVYVESGPGKIIQNVIDSKVANPIIYFDELDKVSETDNGKDIYSFLTYLTDSSQNTQFTDHYFYGMGFDLSRVFYIFTFNDISKIDKILLDRLNIIYIRSPTDDEVVKILSKHCMSEITKNIVIPKEVKIPNNQLAMIIQEYKYLVDHKVSSGVRLYYRVLEKIMLEINKDILLNRFDHTKTITLSTEKFRDYLQKTKMQFLQTVEDTSFLGMYS